LVLSFLNTAFLSVKLSEAIEMRQWKMKRENERETESENRNWFFFFLRWVWFECLKSR
jgi:hypothetical protein